MTSPPSSHSLNSLARRLVQRGLGVPAVFLLEALKPVSVVCQQTVLASSPLARVFGFEASFGELAQVLESRQAMEELALEVERLLEEPERGEP